MVEALTHAAIYVKDMEESLDYYERALGFKKIFELPDPETGEPWIVYIQVCKGQFIELFYTKPGSEIVPDPEVGMNHLCFWWMMYMRRQSIWKKKALTFSSNRAKAATTTGRPG